MKGKEMAKLKFKAKEIKKVMTHAFKGKGHTMTFGYEGETKPALLLVKDEGIYIMSNAQKTDEEVSKGEALAYAVGYEPHSEDCWERCREAVGGDDFGEVLNTIESQSDISDCDNWDFLEVDIDSTSFSASWVRRNRRSA
jgi:hypothetical protein